MSKRIFAFLFLAAALGACGSDFDPSYKLNKARVLAIKTEPPQPAFGESTTLTPLFYFPDPTLPTGEAPTVTRTTWSWCPLPGNSTDGYACPVDQARWNAMVAGLGFGEAPSLDLGEGATGTFTNPFPVELLAYLCSNQASALPGMTTPGSTASQVTIFDCKFGFPVLVRMIAETTAGPIEAVVQVNLPVDNTTPLNTNPSLGGIRLVAPAALAAPLDELGSVIVPRNEKVSFELDLPESNAEDYAGRVVDPESKLFKRNPDNSYVLAPTKERVNVAWYAEVGSFGERGGQRGNLSGYDPTAIDEAGNPIPFQQAFQQAREMIWAAPALFDDKRPEALRTKNRFVVVVRDNRGGVTWTTAHIGMEDK